MRCASWMLITLIMLVDDSPTKNWIHSLGSANEDERFAAIDCLEELGVKALPELRRAMGGEAGPERQRCRELINRIGASRLLRPTSVSIHAKALSVKEILKSLEASSSVSIELGSPGESRWSDRRVSLEIGPTSFFEALDLLGAKCGFRADMSRSLRAPTDGTARVQIIPFDGASPPTSYAGPFKITLTSLKRHRESRQTINVAENLVREDFFASLELSGEPGLVVEGNGPVHIIQANDELDHDLSPSSVEDGTLPGFSTRHWDSTDASTVSIRLPLKLPSERGRVIARLRGFVPIIAFARTDEVASWPISLAAGKTMTVGGMTIMIKKFGRHGGIENLELEARQDLPLDARAFPGGPRQLTQTTLEKGITLDDIVSVEDADGVAYRSQTVVTTPVRPDGFATYRMSLFNARPSKGPARLRLFGVAAVATEVPFDYRELPIP